MDNKNGLREKVWFRAGETVKVKHKLENRPIMLVQEVKKQTKIDFGTKSTAVVPEGAPSFGRQDKSLLQGVTCIWFSKDGYLQSHMFNTKDLVKHVE